jgi:hypothetical protein
MSREAWRSLFDEAEITELTALLSLDPPRFIERAEKAIELLIEYERDHDVRQPDILFVRFDEPSKLRQQFMLLVNITKSPHLYTPDARSLPAMTAALRKSFEAFWCESWPYLNSLQQPEKRIGQKQRQTAQKPVRKRRNGLPPSKELAQEHAELSADREHRREAVPTLAKRYKVTPQAVRQKLRRLERKLNGR